MRSHPYACLALLSVIAVQAAVYTIELQQQLKHLDSLPPGARPFATRSYRQVKVENDYGFAYGVNLKIGNSTLLCQLDTGSSDLWSINKQCVDETCAGSDVSRVEPSNSYRNLDIPIRFHYGTSTFSTYAKGTLGTDTIQFAGFRLPRTTFSSISNTNNSIVQTFSGIFGAGFPATSRSVIARFLAQVDLWKEEGVPRTSQDLAACFTEKMRKYSGLMTKLVVNGHLDKPMFALALQREIPYHNENPGILTLGGIPSGVRKSEITFVPAPASPLRAIVDEDFADLIGDVQTTWTIKIDGVKVNGRQLPTSSVVPSSVHSKYGTLGLIDSGTSVMAFPADQATTIYSMVDYDPSTGTVSCDSRLQVTISIGSKDFPINPVDWLHPLPSPIGIRDRCLLLLFPNDAPTDAKPLTYILGVPLLKNVLAVFDYGSTNVTATSARIGFLSTTNVNVVEKASSPTNVFDKSQSTASRNIEGQTDEAAESRFTNMNHTAYTPSDKMIDSTHHRSSASTASGASSWHSRLTVVWIILILLCT